MTNANLLRRNRWRHWTVRTQRQRAAGSRFPARRMTWWTWAAADVAGEDRSDRGPVADEGDAGLPSPPAHPTVENCPVSAGPRPPQRLLSGSRSDRARTSRQPGRRSTLNPTTAGNCRRSERVRRLCRSCSWKSIRCPPGSRLGTRWPRRQATRSVVCSLPPQRKLRDPLRHPRPSRTQVHRRDRTSTSAGSFQTDPPTEPRCSRTTRGNSRLPLGPATRGGTGCQAADGGQPGGRPGADRMEARMFRESRKTWSLACMMKAVDRQRPDHSLLPAVLSRHNLRHAYSIFNIQYSINQSINRSIISVT